MSNCHFLGCQSSCIFLIFTDIFPFSMPFSPKLSINFRFTMVEASTDNCGLVFKEIFCSFWEQSLYFKGSFIEKEEKYFYVQIIFPEALFLPLEQNEYVFILISYSEDCCNHLFSNCQTFPRLFDSFSFSKFFDQLQNSLTSLA